MAGRKRFLLASVLVGLVIVVVLFLIYPRPTEEKLSGPLADFMSCLPEDLTEEQVLEVEGILIRYAYTAGAGKVSAARVREIDSLLNQYIASGTTSNQEIYTFMAKVSTFSYETDVEHPLLEEVPTDSTLQES